jgi:hypothetical protein
MPLVNLCYVLSTNTAECDLASVFSLENDELREVCTDRQDLILIICCYLFDYFIMVNIIKEKYRSKWVRTR